ncbi:KRAB-A domain-containing 2-like [Brachionus plicatilis]|uniref:KRAB-A domain-containing 2-like n=1 Tax=Brachionus plicatilis TaxID=10195 RepID=A0A3M7SHB7_BRAPC|nr:KRAB-A domain-containing 2-like [Brachionus plicatilis]
MNLFIFVILYSVVTTLVDTQAPMLEVDHEQLHREKFYALYEAKSIKEELQNPSKKRKKTRTVTTLADYQAMIDSIEQALAKTKGRMNREYYIINKYEILKVGDKKKIILKRQQIDKTIRFLVPYEQIFETIYRIHVQIGHKCRDLMLQVCNKNHLYITTEMITGIRESVRTNQARQAESMKTRSKTYIPEVSIGDYVALPIPDVDKGLSEAPNLICRIVDIDYSKSLYELACEAGVLNVLFARYGFDLVKECSVELDIKLDKQLSVREAVKELSIGGGQGILKCNCTAGCLTNRCTCKKAGVLCNSRCHGGNSNCKNK